MVYPLAESIIVGAKGFIGSHLYAHNLANGLVPLGTHHTATEGFFQLDLLDPQIHFATDGYEYALICAGMGTPKLCQELPEKCYSCDVEGIVKLAKQFDKRGITPILFSSAYASNPDNCYGEQKLELEKRIEAELNGNYLIIRLNKVYGTEKGDGTLFDEMAHKLSCHESILAATDYYLSPIAVEELAENVAFLQSRGARGLYYFAAPLSDSRYQMACHIADYLEITSDLIQPISIDQIDGIKRQKRATIESHLPFQKWQWGAEKSARHYKSKKYDESIA